MNNHFVVVAETEDLNSEGFYCTSEQPFSPGEQLECKLLVPANDCGSNLVLRRLARVVRTEIRGLEPGFGIACRFEPN